MVAGPDFTVTVTPNLEVATGGVIAKGATPYALEAIGVNAPILCEPWPTVKVAVLVAPV